MPDSLHEIGPRSTLGCCAALLAAELVTLVIAAPIAYSGFGNIGVAATVLAAAVCWIAGTMALVASAAMRQPSAAGYSLLFGMLFRMGLPLGAGLMLDQSASPLAEAGVFGWIVIFYLVTLVVETLLSLRLIAQERASPAAAEIGTKA